MQQALLADVEHEGRTAALLAAPVAVAGALLLRRWLRTRKLPPGPPSLPIIGCPRMFDQSQLHLAIDKSRREFGDIISFRMGQQTIVAVTSFELMKEMLGDDVFAGRPRFPLVLRITQNCGIIFTEGDSWMEQRRQSLRALRDFGFGRDKSAEMVDVALDAVFEDMDSLCQSQQPRQLLDILLSASNSVIAQLTFGRVFSRHDSGYAAFCDAGKSIIQGQTMDLLELYPALDFIVRQLPTPTGLARLLDTMHSFIDQQIRAREQVMEEADCEPACVCDVYIQAKQKAEQKGDFETFKKMQLVRVCLELFFAGTDTTARSVEWLLLYMALNPDMQRRVQKELDSVVGQSRRPRPSDRTELHYVCAVIDESYRKVSLLAVGVVHRAVRDTYFHGHFIPKEAVILPSVYSVHHDERLWARPQEFNPEHFLDASGRYKSSPHCIPFLIGKRACLGESLARMEVFLMFASIMQRYWLTPSAESVRNKDEILAGAFGFMAIPGAYGLTWSRR